LAWDVRQKCHEKIQLVGAWARQHPNERLVLQGYLEASEGDARDGSLVERRTWAVREALVAAGVDPSHIEVARRIGTLPVCADRTDTCRELNRRVEISLVGQRDSEIAVAAIDPERLPRSVSAP
jgi:outer membrane protein OmpA-like peptidoglycan-associated protein